MVYVALRFRIVLKTAIVQSKKPVSLKLYDCLCPLCVFIIIIINFLRLPAKINSKNVNGPVQAYSSLLCAHFLTILNTF